MDLRWAGFKWFCNWTADAGDGIVSTTAKHPTTREFRPNNKLKVKITSEISHVNLLFDSSCFSISSCSSVHSWREERKVVLLPHSSATVLLSEKQNFPRSSWPICICKQIAFKRSHPGRLSAGLFCSKLRRRKSQNRKHEIISSFPTPLARLLINMLQEIMQIFRVSNVLRSLSASSVERVCRYDDAVTPLCLLVSQSHNKKRVNIKKLFIIRWKKGGPEGGSWWGSWMKELADEKCSSRVSRFIKMILVPRAPPATLSLSVSPSPGTCTISHTINLWREVITIQCEVRRLFDVDSDEWLRHYFSLTSVSSSCDYCRCLRFYCDTWVAL